MGLYLCQHIERDGESMEQRDGEKKPLKGEKGWGKEKADPSHDLHLQPVVLPTAHTLAWHPEDMEIHSCQPL